MNTTDDDSVACAFPIKDWKLEFYRDYGSTRYQHVVLLGTPIECPVPGPLAVGECAVVRSLVDLRTPERAGEIVRQAAGLDVALWAAALSPPDAPLTQKQTEILRRVDEYSLSLIRRHYFAFKVFFNRGRPWNCCNPAVEPLFRKDHPFYAGHPSYPSGHSTEAHTLAHLLARVFPTQAQPLLDVAARIALNRELAGLHFPRDSAAGRLLGKAFADAILGAGEEHRDKRWKEFRSDLDALADST